MSKIDIRYIPIDDARLCDRNTKQHDIDLLIISIKKHGFRNPPIWDSNLNGGTGGIVAGNGRIEALQTMQRRGDRIPAGIVCEGGVWLVPVVFGIDAGSEDEAIAYLFDDNIAGIRAGELKPKAIAQLFDDNFVAELRSLQSQGQMPVSFSAEDLAALLEPTPKEEEWVNLSISISKEAMDVVEQARSLIAEETTLHEKKKIMWGQILELLAADYLGR